MADLTIHDLSDATYRALEDRAQQNGRTTEAEICRILDAAVQPLGTRLAALGRRLPALLTVPPRTDAPEPADFS